MSNPSRRGVGEDTIVCAYGDSAQALAHLPTLLFGTGTCVRVCLHNNLTYARVYVLSSCLAPQYDDFLYFNEETS